MKEENPLIKKFQEKTKIELERIVSSEKHTLKAKEAAKYLLKNNSFRLNEVIAKSKEYRNTKNETKSINKSVSPFNLNLFIKTISYREFLSLISSILLLICFILLRDFYSDYDFISSLYNPFLFILILSSSAFLNHIVYKFEHKRNNNYLGRVITDVAFFIFYSIFLLLYDTDKKIDFSWFLIVLFFVMILELIFYFILKILKSFK
jgi:hypothetical protein